MNNLASLRERINASIADKVVAKVLEQEASVHFKNGYKTGCACEVCDYRRDYAYRQSQSNRNNGYRTLGGGWFDERYHRKELNKVYRKRALEGFSNVINGTQTANSNLETASASSVRSLRPARRGYSGAGPEHRPENPSHEVQMASAGFPVQRG
jgi:site-specific DNA-adenine methylase